jgi:hypothetical protein
MTENPLQNDQSLSEPKASLSETDADAVRRRVNVERLLRLMLDELSETNPSERIHVLSDNRLAGEGGADFLLQIDDYDLRVEVLDAPDNIPTLTPKHLPHLRGLLENNPSTVALVLVWTTDNLAAIPLSVARIRFISENPAQLPGLLTTARPLAEVLRALMARQIKSWEVGLGQKPDLTNKLIDTRHLFEKAIGQAIETERRRSYHLAERRQAAQQFPVEEEKQLIFAVLREALNGVSAGGLVPKLVRLSRRGK